MVLCAGGAAVGGTAVAQALLTPQGPAVSYLCVFSRLIEWQFHQPVLYGICGRLSAGPPASMECGSTAIFKV